VQFQNVAIDITPTTTFLLEPEDWVSEVGFKRGGMLERIRGWVSTNVAVALSEASTLNNSWFEYIAKTKTDVVAFPDPLQVSSYVSEDILWTGGGSFHYCQGTTSLATPFGMNGQKYEFDVKTRRSLVADDAIHLTWAERVNNSIELVRDGLIRCLISEP